MVVVEKASELAPYTGQELGTSDWVTKEGRLRIPQLRELQDRDLLPLRRITTLSGYPRETRMNRKFNPAPIAMISSLLIHGRQTVPAD